MIKALNRNIERKIEKIERKIERSDLFFVNLQGK